MTDEEKKAIEFFKDINQLYFSTDLDLKYTDSEFENSIILLNLIQKQQAELKKKDKIIDLMTEKFENLRIAYLKKEDGGEFMEKYTPYNKNDWKQYFEKEVEGK